MSSTRLAFVVATKDRPRELRRLFQSLRVQTRIPDELVLVDGGNVPLPEDLIREAGLATRYIRCVPPSAARQRNRGLENVSAGVDLVGFIDDDAVFEPEAVGAMMDFWADAGEDVGGASFNLVNHPPVEHAALKRTPFAERLGFYSRRPGAVTVSGFQTMIGCPTETITVEWLPTTASVWRRRVFEGHRFDERFRGYSYLEDLDFSYRVGRDFRLAVVASARFAHWPAPAGRGNDFQFGRREVKARLYFVAKHAGLSRLACLEALALRFGISLVAMVRDRRLAFARRAFGNLVGLAECLAQRDAL